VFGPFVLLVAGLLLLFRYVKQRSGLIAESPLSRKNAAVRERCWLLKAERKARDSFLDYMRCHGRGRACVRGAALLANGESKPVDESEEANVSVYRDQLTELEADCATASSLRISISEIAMALSAHA